jgi:hypothetical protein
LLRESRANDEAVAVVPNVEYQDVSDLIRRRKIGLHIRQPFPFRLAGRVIPDVEFNRCEFVNLEGFRLTGFVPPRLPSTIPHNAQNPATLGHFRPTFSSRANASGIMGSNSYG